MKNEKWYENNNFWKNVRGIISKAMQLDIAHCFFIDNEGNIIIVFNNDLEEEQNQ